MMTRYRSVLLTCGSAVALLPPRQCVDPMSRRGLYPYTSRHNASVTFSHVQSRSVTVIMAVTTCRPKPVHQLLNLPHFQHSVRYVVGDRKGSE
jgi:hypothetical protein